MTPAASAPEPFTRDGHLLLPGLLNEDEAEACALAAAPSATLSGGTRTMLQSAWCAALVQRLRHVLHLLFAPPALPLGLRWHQAV